MSVTGPQHEQIQQALLDAFDEVGLKHLCAIELEEDFDVIVAPGPLEDRVFDLVEWAKKKGKIPRLVGGALRQNPTHSAIRQLARTAMIWPVFTSANDSPLFITDRLAPRNVEEAYLSDLIAKYSEWERKYTSLSGTAIVQDRKRSSRNIISPEFMPTGFEKLVEHGFGPEKHIERVPVGDLREAVTKYRRLVVLGEPGSGKTTTLWRLVYDYAIAAREDPTAPIPLLVLLGGYTGPESTLTYAAQFAGELDLHLPAYLGCGRLVLLLDAMNEMPRNGYEERIGRIQKLIERFPGAPVIVTCRALDYSEDLKLEKVDVKPLDVFRQREYLHRYLGETNGDKLFWQLAGGDAVKDLWAAWQRLGMTFEQLWTVKDLSDDIRSSLTYPQRDVWEALHRDGLPPLLALGANPFLLVMFAQVYASKGALPQNRGKLFAAFVDTLLARERQRHIENWPGADLLIEAFSTLAFAMQVPGKRGTSVMRDWADQTLRNGSFDPESVLYLGAGATLLDTSGGNVRFVHHLLQEYFAATAWQALIARGNNLRRYWPTGWVTPSGWEETAVLLAGMMQDMTIFVEALISVNPPLAARCITESGGAPPTSEVVGKVQHRLVSVVSSTDASIQERAAAGSALNYLGDPRSGVGLRKDGLPDIAWCNVPAGEFLMGDKKETHEMKYAWEMPLHRECLGAFFASMYPITNVQYQAFINNGGYTGKWKQCWTQAGWKWKEDEDIQGPMRFGGDFDAANHPVVGVSWYEAVAFCHWLTKKTGRHIMLPSESQWEKAARGADGRRYPWGQELTTGHANYGKTNLSATNPAGLFPLGESVYGLLDALGNVWEWTTTKWRDRFENYKKPDEELEGGARRALRGGSWNFNERYVHCAGRLPNYPDCQYFNFGFRVVSPGS